MQTGLNCIQEKKKNHAEGVLKPNMETMDGKELEHLWRYRKIFADHEQLSRQSGNL